MASNPCWLRAWLLGKCEATRDIPTACGRKYANYSRVHPSGRRNHAALSVFDTLLSQSYRSSASRNQPLWLSRERSRELSRAQIHRHRVGNKNLRRRMKNSPIETLPFLPIRSSSSTFRLFICKRPMGTLLSIQVSSTTVKVVVSSFDFWETTFHLMPTHSLRLLTLSIFTSLKMFIKRMAWTGPRPLIKRSTPFSIGILPCCRKESAASRHKF